MRLQKDLHSVVPIPAKLNDTSFSLQKAQQLRMVGVLFQSKSSLFLLLLNLNNYFVNNFCHIVIGLTKPYFLSTLNFLKVFRHFLSQILKKIVLNIKNSAESVLEFSEKLLLVLAFLSNVNLFLSLLELKLRKKSHRNSSLWKIIAV